MDLPEDSKDIQDQYIDRPKITFFGREYLILDSLCFVEFLRFCYVASNTKFTENDYQPEELSNELIEYIHNIDHIYPKVIPLMSSKEKLKCHKGPYFLQFYVPNQQMQPEEYVHHMAFYVLSF